MTSKVPEQISPSAPGIDQLHVWRIPLDSPADLDSFCEVLSSDEKMRAERFRMENIRKQFVVAHGALRRILAAYLRSSPKTISFRTGDNGKPKLNLSKNQDETLHFNLSHSGARALVAVTQATEVGVDIEIVRHDADWRGIAKRFFSKDEQAYISSLDQNEQLDAFFRCWTRKEAFLKALGFGIASGLDQFTVDGASDAPTAPIVLSGAFGDSGSWRIRPLEVSSGYMAAAAVSTTVNDVRYFDYQKRIEKQG